MVHRCALFQKCLPCCSSQRIWRLDVDRSDWWHRIIPLPRRCMVGSVVAKIPRSNSQLIQRPLPAALSLPPSTVTVIAESASADDKCVTTYDLDIMDVFMGSTSIVKRTDIWDGLTAPVVDLQQVCDGSIYVKTADGMGALCTIDPVTSSVVVDCRFIYQPFLFLDNGSEVVSISRLMFHTQTHNILHIADHYFHQTIHGQLEVRNRADAIIASIYVAEKLDKIVALYTSDDTNVKHFAAFSVKSKSYVLLSLAPQWEITITASSCLPVASTDDLRFIDSANSFVEPYLITLLGSGKIMTWSARSVSAKSINLLDDSGGATLELAAGMKTTQVGFDMQYFRQAAVNNDGELAIGKAT